MRDTVQAFPDLLTIISPSADLVEFVKKARERGVAGVCLLGMGGSSIAGEVIRGLLWGDTHVPVLSVRNYDVPGFIDETWFIIAVSYSGNTEETLSALYNVRQRGCSCVVITTGGEMIKFADDNPALLLPKDIQPRAALPLLFAAEYALVELLLYGKTQDLQETATWLKLRADEWGSTWPSPSDFATKIFEKIPLFIGWGHLTSVAYRAKCQVNENSKMVAFYSEIPEGNHNEIEGSYDYEKKGIVPVFLRSEFESKRVSQRIDVTSDIFARSTSDVFHLGVKGGTKLQETMALTHYLDMVSVELAEMRGVDPVSVERIGELKSRLSNMKGYD